MATGRDRDPRPPPAANAGVDGRGGVAVLALMLAIALASLRPAPQPALPGRVAPAQSAAWMADALPGVGPRTREAAWRCLQAETPAALPLRAQATARQVFAWPAGRGRR